MAWNCVAPLEAAVLVLVLVLVDTQVCVGGERFVGGVVGAAGRGCGSAIISYGWMPHNAGFGFLDLTPSILLLRQFWD
jgi:hypothetical protein